MANKWGPACRCGSEDVGDKDCPCCGGPLCPECYQRHLAGLYSTTAYWALRISRKGLDAIDPGPILSVGKVLFGLLTIARVALEHGASVELAAEHDCIYFSSYDDTAPHMDKDDLSQLDESGWYEDTGAWKHWV